MSFFLLASLFSLGAGYLLTDWISGDGDEDEGGETTEPETGEDSGTSEPKTDDGDEDTDEPDTSSSTLEEWHQWIDTLPPIPKLSEDADYDRVLDDHDGSLDFGRADLAVYTDGDVIRDHHGFPSSTLGTENQDWIEVSGTATVDAGAGNDLLVIGSSNDTADPYNTEVTGGEGDDLFFVELSGDQPGMATIKDFTPGQDVLHYGSESRNFRMDDLDIQTSEAVDGSFTDISFAYTDDDPENAGNTVTHIVRLEGVSGIDPDNLEALFGHDQPYGPTWLEQVRMYDGEFGLKPVLHPHDDSLPVVGNQKIVEEDTDTHDAQSDSWLQTGDLDDNVNVDGVFATKIETGAGNDTISGYGHDVLVYSGSGDDEINLNSNLSVWRAGILYNEFGHNIIDPGKGADRVTFDSGAFVIASDDGAVDILTYKADTDSMMTGYKRWGIDAPVSKIFASDDDDQIIIDVDADFPGYLLHQEIPYEGSDKLIHRYYLSPTDGMNADGTFSIPSSSIALVDVVFSDVSTMTEGGPSITTAEGSKEIWDTQVVN